MTNPLCDPAARLVIAHRGDRLALPENTLEALSQAEQLGADALEFDVRVTRDGIPVVIHDPTVDRTTNGRGLVSNFTRAELESLDAAARHAKSSMRLRIPSLEELLDRFRRTPLVIEVKEVAAIEPTEELVRRFGAKERVVIGSSNATVMARFYRSELRTCASMRDAIRMIPAALMGLRPGKLGYDVLSVTPRYGGLPVPVLRMAAAARKAGIATQVWTVNDPALARSLWAGGVAGIITDDPAAILRARER